MAARKWSYLPNVTGKNAQQHFELISISPKSTTSEENLSSTVSSSRDRKPKRKRPSDAVQYNKKRDRIYLHIENQKISQALQTSASEGPKRFTSDGCISAGSIVMRLSTDVPRKALELNGRSLTPEKEKNSVLCSRRSLAPSPSTISTIIDTEFAAHNQRKTKKWIGKQNPTAGSASSFKEHQQGTSHNHILSRQPPFIENIDEKLKIKIEHHKNMIEPVRCEVNASKDKQFKKRISKIIKFPPRKFCSTTSPADDSIISYHSSNEIILDECDYIKKTKSCRPLETFAVLSLSDDEYDSSDSSLASRSFASTDDSAFGNTKDFPCIENCKYMNAHRERCESLLKEAERIRSERSSKCNRKDSSSKRTSRTPTRIPIPAAYYVSNAPINAPIKNNADFLSEKRINKVKGSFDHKIVCGPRNRKKKESTDSQCTPLAFKQHHHTRNIIVNGSAAAALDDVSYEMKITHLKKRLNDWKAMSSKSQVTTTQEIIKKNTIENKQTLKSNRQDQVLEKEDKSVISKEPEKLEEDENDKVGSEQIVEAKKGRRGVLGRVIPNWFRFFGSKKPQESGSIVEKNAGKGESPDKEPAPVVDKAVQKEQKCK